MNSQIPVGAIGSVRRTPAGRILPVLAAVSAVLIPAPHGGRAMAAQPGCTAPADGWAPLYNGTFDEFRIYFRGQGYIDDPKAQDVYVAEPGMIHVRKGTNGLLVTKKPYGNYHVRVDYRWGENVGSKPNAGLMTHVDLASTVVTANRPRSIEINMREDVPGSIWLAGNLGPFASTFVAPETRIYLPREMGGVRFDGTPFGDRTIYARYRNDEMPTKPRGEWNTMEAIVRGSESLTVIINGQEVVRLFDIRQPAEGEQKPGEPLAEGGVALQSEGHEVFYRNFEIRPLDPAGKP